MSATAVPKSAEKGSTPPSASLYSPLSKATGGLTTPAISSPVNKPLAISIGDTLTPAAVFAAVIAKGAPGIKLAARPIIGSLRTLAARLSSLTKTEEYVPTGP